MLPRDALSTSSATQAARTRQRKPHHRCAARRLTLARACRPARCRYRARSRMPALSVVRAWRAAASPTACCDRCLARCPGPPARISVAVLRLRPQRANARADDFRVTFDALQLHADFVLRADGDVPRLIADAQHDTLAGWARRSAPDRRRSDTACCSPRPARAQLPPPRRRPPRIRIDFAHGGIGTRLP